MDPDHDITFADLALPEPLARVIADVGYERPSPIQAACIPLLLQGRDLLGQAQTGTGKTAAFALPLLARVDTGRRVPQLLVLAPTRELAIQVAEAMQRYAHYLDDFHVLPIYGGQSYTVQLKHLHRGVQVVVGTPGRVMDHMRRGTLKLDDLAALVLDEADEMLRMGFIDDVEWILEHTPPGRQIALFSATMPGEIRTVAERHLDDPATVRIKSATTTAATIRQRCWMVDGLHKLDALTRVLETEPIDAAIVFVRTKLLTDELAERLSARGFSAEALNGDIPQALREKTVARLKDGRLDILVATDVAARGLDVPRVSHVINYDIPYDSESYTHRIGRTGRAGRSGEAILFVAPRERRMLKTIERATGQPIETMAMPSIGEVNEGRVNRFKQRIVEALQTDEDLGPFYRTVKEIESEHEIDPLRIAAVLASMVQGDVPLLLRDDGAGRDRQGPSTRPQAAAQDGPRAREPGGEIDTTARPLKEFPDIEMERFRIEVGHRHGVKPANIVGAIANEADLESRYIGHIGIHDDFSTVDLPAGMPKETLRDLKKAWICGRQLQMTRLAASGAEPEPRPGKRRVKEKERQVRPRPPGRGTRRGETGPDRAARRGPPKGSRRKPPGGKGRDR